jgi:hypothetical protein
VTERQFKEILELNGFTLKRQKKHLIYSNGKQTFTTSKTPSCERAWKNNYHQLKRVLAEAGREFITEEPKRMKEKDMSGFNTPRATVLPTQATTVRPMNGTTSAPLKTKTLDKDALDLALKLREQGKKQHEIATILMAQGYVSITGKKLDQTQVSVFLRQNGHRTFAPYSKANSAPTYESAPLAQPPRRKKKNAGLLHQLTEILSSNLAEDVKEELVILMVHRHERAAD